VPYAHKSFQLRKFKWITKSQRWGQKASSPGIYSLKGFIVTKTISKSFANLATRLNPQENSINVNKAIVTNEGTVTFQGELSPEEHDFVLQVGLTYLYENGSLPFTSIDEEEVFNYGGTSSEEAQ
jgi:hypothetical protein